MPSFKNAPSINALGFVEVRGLAAAIATADAMLKSADVRLLRALPRDPALTTLTVEGALGACHAAVDAGRTTAESLEALVAAWVMGRPADDTAAFVLEKAVRGQQPFGEALPPPKPTTPSAQTPAIPTKPEAGEAESELIRAIASFPNGCGIQNLMKRLKTPLAAETVRAQLDALCASGRLIKQRGRYLVAPNQDSSS